MVITKSLKWIVVGVVFIVLTNLQFFPSFGVKWLYGFSQLAYNILSILNIPLILIGLIVLFSLIWRLIARDKISKKIIMISIIGSIGLLNMYVFKPILGRTAINTSIRHAMPLINSIDAYQQDNLAYPDSLSDLIPNYLLKIPETGIIGIYDYQYKRIEDSYEVCFYQNDIMSFNYNVVIYNPIGTHKGRGEIPVLKDTKYKNWKYFWLD